jgi:uncharacterized protein YqgV (UPF0045/DUF77 family)
MPLFEEVKGYIGSEIKTSDLDFLLILVKKVHQVHLEEGAKKIAIGLNGGDRRDKGAASKTSGTMLPTGCEIIPINRTY